jgi:hypothetical protein
MKGEEIGLNADQLVRLNEARIDAAIATREEDLASRMLTDTDEARIALIKEELRLLNEKKSLVSANAAAQAAADAAKKAEEEWKRTSENIERSLIDALMRGFEGGKDAAKNFRHVLWNMFRTLVLQPLIKPIVEPWAQGMSDLGKMIQHVLSGVDWTNAQLSAQAAAEAAIPLEAFGGYSAAGNVFASRDLHRHANTIVSRPTLFRFAQGGAFGVMGEAGPEAIMPLRRGTDGRLGVEAVGGGISNNVNIVVNAQGSQVQGDSASAAELGRRIDAAVRGVLLAERRPGGLLAGA